MSKKAFITGITGQDGSYLSEHLLNLGYEVFGLVRRNSVTEHQVTRIDKLRSSLNLFYGDLLDQSSIDKNLKKIKPDEIYNLASQSHVRVSYDVPQFTVQTNALGVVNLLESVKIHCPNAKIYQASSSEMFGNSKDSDGMQRESTPMHPVSPYGCSKLFSYSLLRNYRKAFNLFASNGILFNHESPRRATNFVTTKIVSTAIQIKKGNMKYLELGNLDSQRDWGHSKDYVKAMHLILKHNEPDDFVISTGKTKSIRDFCNMIFSKLDMNYEDYVKINPKFIRPEELNYLCGDSSKAKKVLGWKPEYSFESMVDEILEHFLKNS
jgi:GDPmannose 4,6-dehydratase